MSEPKSVAAHFEEIEDVDVVFWHVDDDRLGGFISTAYGLRTDEGMVLIDPLPLEQPAFEALGPIQAIVLSSGSHQRSAWRLRGELEVPVWALRSRKSSTRSPTSATATAPSFPGTSSPPTPRAPARHSTCSSSTTTSASSPTSS